MTNRQSTIKNSYWLLHAEPALFLCAAHELACNVTAIPSDLAAILQPQRWNATVAIVPNSASRSAKINVASNARSQSP